MNASSGSKPLILNVASVCKATRTLGPGLRSAVWVQGCPFHCTGCIAPDWIENKKARLVSAEDLVEELLENIAVSGLTFSGGEPMQQAGALAQVARIARSRKNINIICFSGYRLENLINNPPNPGVFELLDQLDVLIDGLYISSLNDNRGLRGSSNQRIHYLSPRLQGVDLENSPRKVEFQIDRNNVLMVGVPPQRVANVLDLLPDARNNSDKEQVSYERL